MAKDLQKLHQRGTASTGHNFMRRFQVYRKDRWVTIKTLKECLNLVMEHSGRDFYADMKDSPDSYSLSFKPSQFVSNDNRSNDVSIIDDDDEDDVEERSKRAKIESEAALFGSDSDD